MPSCRCREQGKAVKIRRNSHCRERRSLKSDNLPFSECFFAPGQRGRRKKAAHAALDRSRTRSFSGRVLFFVRRNL